MAPISRSCSAGVRACRCRPTSAHCPPTIVGQARVPPLTRHELDPPYVIGLEHSISKMLLPPRLPSLVTLTPVRTHFMAPRDTFRRATTWSMRTSGDLADVVQFRAIDANNCTFLCVRAASAYARWHGPSHKLVTSIVSQKGAFGTNCRLAFAISLMA